MPSTCCMYRLFIHMYTSDFTAQNTFVYTYTMRCLFTLLIEWGLFFLQRFGFVVVVVGWCNFLSHLSYPIPFNFLLHSWILHRYAMVVVTFTLFPVVSFSRTLWNCIHKCDGKKETANGGRMRITKDEEKEQFRRKVVVVVVSVFLAWNVRCVCFWQPHFRHRIIRGHFTFTHFNLTILRVGGNFSQNKFSEFSRFCHDFYFGFAPFSHASSGVRL